MTTITKRMRVQFMDEAPRIGQGWRIVYVENGRKWMKVRDCLGNRAKFTIAQWERIAKTAADLPPLKRRRVRKVKRMLDKAVTV